MTNNDTSGAGNAADLPMADPPPVENARHEIIQYTGAVFDPDDIVEIRQIWRDNGESRTSHDWTSAARLADKAASLLSDNARGRNIFIGANPRPSKGEKGDACIEMGRAIFADFDGVDPTEAAERWDSYGLPEPTLVVASGHGCHLYLRLTEPTTDLAAWRELQHDLAVALDADPKVRNAERVMRLPGFNNTKSAPFVPCRIIQCDARQRADFSAVRQIVSPRPAPVPQVKAAPAAPRADNGWNDRVERCRAYIDRMPGAVSGEGGHDRLYAAACVCFRFGLSDSQAEHVLLEFNSRCDPPWSESEIQHKIIDARQAVERDGQYGVRLNEPVRRGNGTTPGSPLLPAPDDERVAYAPFPTDALPSPLRRLAEEGASSIGCPACFIALPMLSALGAAIGTTRRIEIKKGWSEPSIIWTAVVGESGSMKSPAMGLALEPIRRLEQEADKANTEAAEEHKAERLRYEKELAQWKNKSGGGDPPTEPAAPVFKRWVVSDATVEAMGERLADNRRGLLLFRDELSGWLGGFDQYKGGKGGDAASWLEFHVAGSISIDRRSRPPLHVSNASVAVTGGIQPGVLRDAMKGRHVQSGMLARFILSFPPSRVIAWTEDEVRDSTRRAVQDVFEKLSRLQHGADEGGQPLPVVVKLREDAKSEWVPFFNEVAAETSGSFGALNAAIAKLRGHTARIALILHLSRWASGERVDPDHVDLDSMRSAIRIGRWAGEEIRRAYLLCGFSNRPADAAAAADEVDELLEFVRGRGGQTTCRDLLRSKGRYGNAAKARTALDALRLEGLGDWQRVPAGARGGAPSEVFFLHPDAADTTDTTPLQLTEPLSESASGVLSVMSVMSAPSTHAA